jgi:hypothetical protein
VTILAELSGTVTVVDDGSAYLLGDVEVTDANPFYFTLTVDARAAVAFAQRFQQLGVGITINGIPIPDREIGNVLTITESRDSYGDRCTLQIIGERFSPFARSLIRSKAHVQVSTVTGNTLYEFRKRVFDGYIVEPTFDGQPPAANITCLDAAALHAQKRAKQWTLPPNSGRSRLSIGLELCALTNIPTGFIDLGGDGGVVRKPLAPGDQPVLDFIRDLWGITGAEIGFEDGLLCARRYDPAAPAVLEINAGNILLPFGIALPSTLDPNITGVVSVSYSQSELGGVRTDPPLSVVQTAVYAPVAHAFRQVVVLGEATLIPNSAPPSASMRVVSEVVTQSSYFGSIAVRTEQETRGWYAELGYRNQIEEIVDPPGYELVPLDAYIYADGTTRARPQETFQTTSRTITTRELDTQNRVILTREERYFMRFYRRALWSVSTVGGDDTLIADGAFINDDGDGVTGPEQIGRYGPDETTETKTILATDGTIAKEIVTERFYEIGSKRPRSTGALGYGVDPVTYTSRSAEAIAPTHDPSGIIVTTTTYRRDLRNEDRYHVTKEIRVGTKSPVIETSTLTGSPPRPEQAEPETVSQEIRYAVEDRERIALVGQEIENDDDGHNELIETRDEAAVYARHLARIAGARVLNCAVAIEPLAHKFRMVRVNLPGTSIDGLKFYITDVERDAASYREAITAEYYAPELG